MSKEKPLPPIEELEQYSVKDWRIATSGWHPSNTFLFRNVANKGPEHKEEVKRNMEGLLNSGKFDDDDINKEYLKFHFHMLSLPFETFQKMVNALALNELLGDLSDR